MTTHDGLPPGTHEYMEVGYGSGEGFVALACTLAGPDLDATYALDMAILVAPPGPEFPTAYFRGETGWRYCMTRLGGTRHEAYS
jgi:hypothetical protein